MKTVVLLVGRHHGAGHHALLRADYQRSRGPIAEPLVAGVEQGAFRDAAEAARRGCPVSQALQGNVEMELDAKLE